MFRLHFIRAVSLFVLTVQSSSAAPNLPRHLTVVSDMTGLANAQGTSVYQRDFQRLMPPLLSLLRRGDRLTVIRVCGVASTRYDAVLERPLVNNFGEVNAQVESAMKKVVGDASTKCQGKGSAVTQGLKLALNNFRPDEWQSLVIYVDGAVMDDPQRKALPEVFGEIVKRSDVRNILVAGLADEAQARDVFTQAIQVGRYPKEAQKVLFSGSRELNQVYSTFARRFKKGN